LGSSGQQIISNMDFTKPCDPISVNGFPVYFRREFINDETTLWIPKGISRNESIKAWRIWFRHQKGTFSKYVFDSGRDMVSSLKEAWNVAYQAYMDHEPYVAADKRRKAPGFRVHPDFDLGYTGVSITRVSPKRGSKTIVLLAHQNYLDPLTKEKKHTNLAVCRVTMNKYEEDPWGQQKIFENGIRDAIAIRRYHNQLHSQCTPPTRKLKLEDVPLEIRRKPAPFPIFDLSEIFDSIKPKKTKF